MTRWMLVLSLLLVCCSCGDRIKEKPLFPVIGKVLVDNKPVGQLAIRCISATGIDQNDPTTSATFTQEDGSFSISTYRSGDGVPEGDYSLTFQWGERNLMNMSYSGDKFNGKYSDPNASTIKFTVKPGVPTDLGTIELTTK